MASCQYIVSGSADAAMVINGFIVSISASLFGTTRTSNATLYGPCSTESSAAKASSM